MDMGIRKSDGAGVYAKNRFDSLDLLFACGKTGSILVPFNTRLTPREIEYLVKRTDPKTFFYDPSMRNEYQAMCASLEKRPAYVMGGFDVDETLSLI